MRARIRGVRGPTAASIDAKTSERQILVMLRVPPPHFRPDASYLGSYDAQSGRDARDRIANGLATKFKLQVIDSWPMPALGVDCIVMQAPEGVPTDKLLEEIARDTRVEWAQSMNLFHLLSHNDPLFALQPAAKVWHLAEIHQIATGRMSAWRRSIPASSSIIRTCQVRWRFREISWTAATPSPRRTERPLPGLSPPALTTA